MFFCLILNRLRLYHFRDGLFLFLLITIADRFVGWCFCSFVLCCLNPPRVLCVMCICLSTAGPVYIRREETVMVHHGTICFSCNVAEIWCSRQTCSIAVLEITAAFRWQFSVLLNRFSLSMYTSHIVSDYFGSSDKLASYLCWKYERSVASGGGASCFFLAMSPHHENNEKLAHAVLTEYTIFKSIQPSSGI